MMWRPKVGALSHLFRSRADRPLDRTASFRTFFRSRHTRSTLGGRSGPSPWDSSGRDRWYYFLGFLRQSTRTHLCFHCQSCLSLRSSISYWKVYQQYGCAIGRPGDRLIFRKNQTKGRKLTSHFAGRVTNELYLPSNIEIKKLTIWVYNVILGGFRFCIARYRRGPKIKFVANTVLIR